MYSIFSALVGFMLDTYDAPSCAQDACSDGCSPHFDTLSSGPDPLFDGSVDQFPGAAFDYGDPFEL